MANQVASTRHLGNPLPIRKSSATTAQSTDITDEFEKGAGSYWWWWCHGRGLSHAEVVCLLGDETLGTRSSAHYTQRFSTGLGIRAVCFNSRITPPVPNLFHEPRILIPADLGRASTGSEA